MLIIKDANQSAAQVLDVPRPGVDRRFFYAASRRKIQVTEIRFVAGAGRWVGYVQSGLSGHANPFSFRYSAYSSLRNISAKTGQVVAIIFAKSLFGA